MTDRELLTRVAEKDGEAEAEICRRFAPRIRLYGLRHLRTPERSRDLVQSVLLAVLVAARSGRVEDPEHFDRFVLGTCRNIARRMREGEERLVFAGDEALDVATYSQVEHLDMGALIRCVSKLGERARMVVYFSFHEEREPAEIAAALETTIGNVRVLRHRAIADLRKCLEVRA